MTVGPWRKWREAREERTVGTPVVSDPVRAPVVPLRLHAAVPPAPLPSCPVMDTPDEALAREQVVDCAVAWAACPSEANARDLRAAVAVLRRADGGADPLPEDDAPGASMDAYRRQVLADYYWGR